MAKTVIASDIVAYKHDNMYHSLNVPKSTWSLPRFRKFEQDMLFDIPYKANWKNWRKKANAYRSQQRTTWKQNTARFW